MIIYFSGVHLKDIISLHVALQDRLEYDLINFRKLAQLSITFRTLTNLQLSMPPVQPNHDLINLLTVVKTNIQNTYYLNRKHDRNNSFAYFLSILAFIRFELYR